jgi:coenzyme Q-binding protein COQ10
VDSGTITIGFVFLICLFDLSWHHFLPNNHTMPSHREQKLLPYPTDFVFDLVADVARYPEFVPWCVSSKILRCGDSWFMANLGIGYKLIQERFTSKVLLDRANRIDVEYFDGPFRTLTNSWQFQAVADDQCMIDFSLAFEFKSRLLQTVVEGLFLEVVRRMVGAFEQRALQIYTKQIGLAEDSPNHSAPL